MEDYKSNSDKARQEQQSEKKVEAVITGTAKTRKKGEMQKFADVFIAEDANNVKSYILMEVIVPAVKKAISDKQSYPVLAEAEPVIMADLLMESPNLTPEVKNEPDYPLTQEEIDLIALVTMGEAEGETELGKRLVIDTILNRIDHPSFPDTVYDVIYQPNQFSVMWNSRIDRCYVMPEIVELVKEELLERTNYDCVFFMAGGYSKYGEPLFQECCHYFSS